MKGSVLSVAVACALSGVMLTACGGGGDSGSDNSGGGTEPVSKPQHTAVFVDAAVGGLNYRCDDYAGVTNAKGEFLFDDGDSCAFSMGNQPLGSVMLKAGNSLVTPYGLAGDDKDKAIRIAALLQTLDSDNNPENGITLDKTQVEKLGIIEWSSDDAFNTSLSEALKKAGLDKAVVSLAKAKAHLSATLTVVNGRSVAVDRVLSDLQGLTDLKSLDVESKLKQYKDELTAETSEEGKVDRQVMLAVIALMEVTNDPVVSKIFSIESTSSMSQNYNSMLAKVLDLIVQPAAFSYFKLDETQQDTSNITTLISKYAAQLELVSNQLNNIVNPEYQATYGDNEQLRLNYAQVQGVRASALAMASALNIFSSYQYGSPSVWQERTEDVTLNKAAVINSWNQESGPSRRFEYSQDLVEAQYLDANIRPANLLNDTNFFRLTSDAKVLLAKAKKQLQEAASLALMLNVSSEAAKPAHDELLKLQKHLAGELPSIDLHSVVLIDDSGEWLGENVNAVYTVNLNPFFDEGFDRSDINLDVTEYCEQKVGTYDANLSKSLDMAMCSVSQDEFTTLLNDMEDRGAYNPFPYLDWMYNSSEGINESGPIYAQGVRQHPFTFITQVEGSTFAKIFKSCKANLVGEEELVPASCEQLVSNQMSAALHD